MNITFWIECLTVRFFCNKNTRKKFITIHYLNNFEIKKTQIMEKIFNKDFDVNFYNYLLESSLFSKNLLLMQHCIHKTDLSIQQNQQEILSPLHNLILTDNLKKDNYYSWLAIIASHSSLQLIGLEKKYNYEDYYNFLKTFILNDTISQFFKGIETQTLILKNCHNDAVKMFEFIFMDLKLGTNPSKKTSKVIKI